MTKFRYLGESPNGPFEQFGATFEHGSVGEVTDPAHVEILRGNAAFQEVGDGVAVTPSRTSAAIAALTEPLRRRPGRPRKEVIDADPDDAATE